MQQVHRVQLEILIKIFGGRRGGTNIAQNVNRSSSINAAKSGNRKTNRSSSNNITSSSNANSPKRNIWNGVYAVTGRYFKPVAETALGLVTGGAGAMIGIAAVVAQGGDIGAALTGGLAGGAAGMKLSKAAIDLPGNIKNGIENGLNNVTDTYREGAHGKEYADKVKTKREFKNSSAYRNLRIDSELSEKEFDQKVTQMLDAGIQDTKRMKKILKNNKKHPRKYSMDKAIAYSAMAEKCPEGILYSNSRFIRFCKDNDIEISAEELENLRKCIIDFK